VYARRLQIDIVTGEGRRPCPLDWLDQFAMRNFTGSAEFDDTLPVSDGVLEAGLRVDPERLSAALSEWLTRRGKGEGRAVTVEIREVSRSRGC
jgi:hypothetical protein